MRWIFTSAMCVSFSVGCTHVAYVHRSSGGIDLGVAPTEGHVTLTVGGERETYAAVPRRTDGDGEAMALVAVSRVRLAGLRDIRFGHAIATGKSAVQIAAKPTALQDIVKKIHDEDAPAPAAVPATAPTTGLTPITPGGGR